LESGMPGRGAVDPQGWENDHLPIREGKAPPFSLAAVLERKSRVGLFVGHE